MHADLVEQFRRRRALQATIRRRRPTLRRKLPRQLFPRHLERDYLGKLLDLLRLTHARVRATLVPQLAGLVREQSAIRGDAPAGDVDETLSAVRLELGGVFSSSNLERIVQPLGVGISRAQRDQLGRQVRAAVGVDVPLADPNLSAQLEAWTQENVGLIKTIPRQYLDQVQSTVLAGLTGGDRWEEIAGNLEQRFNVAESRAALIARDQVGKFYGSLQRARQANLGVTHYFWRTAGDERVRPEHEEREGERFAWSDPPWDGHPGHPINCRCTADPDLAAMLEQLGEGGEAATPEPERKAREPESPAKPAEEAAPAEVEPTEISAAELKLLERINKGERVQILTRGASFNLAERGLLRPVEAEWPAGSYRPTIAGVPMKAYKAELTEAGRALLPAEAPARAPNMRSERLTEKQMAVMRKITEGTYGEGRALDFATLEALERRGMIYKGPKNPDGTGVWIWRLAT